jgi:hypothetical protein
MTPCYEHLASFQKWDDHDGSVGIWAVRGELTTSLEPWRVDNNYFLSCGELKVDSDVSWCLNGISGCGHD